MSFMSELQNSVSVFMYSVVRWSWIFKMLVQKINFELEKKKKSKFQKLKLLWANILLVLE